MATVTRRQWTTKEGDAREGWVLRYSDRQHERHQLQFPTKAEAERERRRVERELDDGTHTPAKKSVTLKVACDMWLDYVENVRPKKIEECTLVSYRQHLAVIKGHEIAALKLSDLSTPNVSKFSEFLTREERVSASTARKTMFVLNSVLNRARRNGYVAQNVASGVKIDGDSKRHEQPVRAGVDFPTMVEAGQIINSAKGDRARSFLMVAAFCGLRAGEMRGLTWGKVNLHAHTIDVAQRADNMKGLNIGAPKSRDSRRTVPMPPSVAHALRYLKTVSLFTNDSDYVWPNEEGGVAKLSALVTEIFNPAHVASGIPLVDYQPKYRPHAWRHFFASLCAARPSEGGFGLTMEETRVRMGHSSIVMTQRYKHLFCNSGSNAKVEAKAAAGVLQHKMPVLQHAG